MGGGWSCCFVCVRVRPPTGGGISRQPTRTHLEPLRLLVLLGLDGGAVELLGGELEVEHLLEQLVRHCSVRWFMRKDGGAFFARARVGRRLARARARVGRSASFAGGASPRACPFHARTRRLLWREQEPTETGVRACASCARGKESVRVEQSRRRLFLPSLFSEAGNAWVEELPSQTKGGWCAAVSAACDYLWLCEEFEQRTNSLSLFHDKTPQKKRELQ